VPQQFTEGVLQQRLTSIQKFFDGQVRYQLPFSISDPKLSDLQIPRLFLHLDTWPLLKSRICWVDRDPVTKKMWWYTTSDKHRPNRLEVPEKFKQIFAEKKITCGSQLEAFHIFFSNTNTSVEYHDLTPAAERDIFQRVQLGMSLTAAGRSQSIFVE